MLTAARGGCDLVVQGLTWWGRTRTAIPKFPFRCNWMLCIWLTVACLHSFSVPRLRWKSCSEMLRKNREMGPTPGNCSTIPGNACTPHHLGCILLLRIPRMHTHSWELFSQSWEFKCLRCMLLELIP